MFGNAQPCGFRRGFGRIAVEWPVHHAIQIESTRSRQHDVIRVTVVGHAVVRIALLIRDVEQRRRTSPGREEVALGQLVRRGIDKRRRVGRRDFVDKVIDQDFEAATDRDAETNDDVQISDRIANRDSFDYGQLVILRTEYQSIQLDAKRRTRLEGHIAVDFQDARIQHRTIDRGERARIDNSATGDRHIRIDRARTAQNGTRCAIRIDTHTADRRCGICQCPDDRQNPVVNDRLTAVVKCGCRPPELQLTAVLLGDVRG